MLRYYSDSNDGLKKSGDESGSPRQQETSPIAMSRIPWRLEILDPSAATATERGVKDTASNKKIDPQASSSPPPVVAFLQKSYLDLRRQQNIGWAEERLVEGVAFSQSQSKHAFQKAEDCYKKGLDIVPDHTDLLTAYGALLASVQTSSSGSHQPKPRTDEALDLLDQALALDPHHKNARTYKQAILDREMAAEACVMATQGVVGTNAAGAFKRSDGDDSDDSFLATGSSWAERKLPPQQGTDLPEISKEKYPMLSLDGDGDDGDDNSGEEDGGDSSSTSSDGESRRKRKHKRRKRKHGKSRSKRRKEGQKGKAKEKIRAPRRYFRRKRMNSGSI